MFIKNHPVRLLNALCTFNLRSCVQSCTLQFQTIGGGGPNKRGGLTDHLNINKRGAKIKGERGGVAENCSQSKVETSSY